jgi:ATP-dependent Clp protease protease subunit
MKQPLSITSCVKDGIAQINIDGDIINDQNSSKDFTAAVDQFISGGVKDVNLLINSMGGSCFEANEIVNVIKKFPGKVNGIGGAIVASAATYIAVSCSSFSMPENGLFMIHKPSVNSNGNVDEMESDVKLLKSLTEIYANAYAKKTGMTIDQIEAMWKTDCWLTTEEAIKLGFIDSVSDSDEVINMTAFDQALQDWAYKTVPVAIFNILKQSKKEPLNPKPESMKKIALALGKPENSTEEEIATSVATLVAEKKVLQDKVSGFESQRLESMKAEAGLLVDAAVKDGRIEAATKEHYTKLFESNHEAAKAALASLRAHASVAARLNSLEANTDDLAKLNWDDLDRGNHLVRLKTENPDLYKAKFIAKFGKEPQA